MQERIGRTAVGAGDAAWARQRPPRVSIPPPNRSRPRRVTAVAASVIRSSGKGSGAVGGKSYPIHLTISTTPEALSDPIGPDQDVARTENCHADEKCRGRLGGGPQERKGNREPGERGLQGGVLVPVPVRVGDRDQPRGVDRSGPRRLLLDGPVARPGPGRPPAEARSHDGQGAPGE